MYDYYPQTLNTQFNNGGGGHNRTRSSKSKCSFGRSLISCMNISSVRLMRVRVNLYTFQRRNYAWDEFLLFVDVLYFSSRLFCCMWYLEIWICGPEDYNNINAVCATTQERQKYGYITLFWSAKSRFAHFLFEFDISIISICVWSNMVLYIFTLYNTRFNIMKFYF